MNNKKYLSVARKIHDSKIKTPRQLYNSMSKELRASVRNQLQSVTRFKKHRIKSYNKRYIPRKYQI